MYIVQIAPECAPVAKVGGLADVIYGLSRELEIRGNEVHIILPKYDCMRYDQIWGLQISMKDLWVPWYNSAIHCSVWFGFVQGRKCFFIEPHSPDNFFNRGHFYGFKDDVSRFAFFSKAALEFLLKDNRRPDIIHCHDWQTGLVPVLLFEQYAHAGMHRQRVCYTIHNFKHQGLTGDYALWATGLTNIAHYFNYDRLRDNFNHTAVNLGRVHKICFVLETAGCHPRLEELGMDRWYYLTDEQFEQINRRLPPEEGRRGRPPAVKNRAALEGILHILRTGTPWRDLPSAYGSWHTLYMRWQRWIKRGVWWEILKLLKRLKGVDLKIVFLDSTVVRVHQHAAGAAREKGDQAIGRSRGGLTTKIHLLCASETDGVDIRITAGQAGDAPVGETLIDALDPCEGIQQAAMDKAYDSNTLRAQLDAKGITPVIPPKSNRLDIIVYDQELYKQRNKVERLFNKLKQFRRVATRYEKLKDHFLAFVTLALIVIMLR